MATEKWVVVGRKECELIHQQVELRQKRVYPTADFLQQVATGYRVQVCLCTAAIDCNLAGIPCKWALNAPDTDRF